MRGCSRRCSPERSKHGPRTWISQMHADQVRVTCGHGLSVEIDGCFTSSARTRPAENEVHAVLVTNTPSFGRKQDYGLNSMLRNTQYRHMYRMGLILMKLASWPEGLQAILNPWSQPHRLQGHEQRTPLTAGGTVQDLPKPLHKLVAYTLGAMAGRSQVLYQLMALPIQGYMDPNVCVTVTCPNVAVSQTGLRILL